MPAQPGCPAASGDRLSQEVRSCGQAPASFAESWLVAFVLRVMAGCGGAWLSQTTVKVLLLQCLEDSAGAVRGRQPIAGRV